jgi:hypothetical protein
MFAIRASALHHKGKPERAGSGLTRKCLSKLKRLVRGKRCILLDHFITDEEKVL